MKKIKYLLIVIATITNLMLPITVQAMNYCTVPGCGAPIDMPANERCKTCNAPKINCRYPHGYCSVDLTHIS
ncbi:MAG: hypothetical protein LBV33_05325 [Lachnospiraceae bacterium]|nr:hypothetical protein [Lachnospiraceae bacterium]